MSLVNKNTGQIKWSRIRLNWIFLPAIFSVWFCFVQGTCAADPLRRIISLSPIVTETIYLLDAQNLLIANTTYCTVPPDAGFKEKIGSVKQANVEKIVSLGPDIVIACSLTNQRQIEKLEKLNVPVVKIENPTTFEMMCRVTKRIGCITGKKGRAALIVEQAQKEVNAVWRQTSRLHRPRVFIQIGIKPLHSANSQTFIHEYIHYGGGQNIAARERSGIYSREKVLRENPDVILIATMGTSKKAAEIEKQRWLKFCSIQAVKDLRVHVLDPEIICSPTPVTFVKGLRIVLPLIHPEAGEYDER